MLWGEDKQERFRTLIAVRPDAYGKATRVGGVLTSLVNRLAVSAELPDLKKDPNAL